MIEADSKDSILDRICIAMPCSMSWEEMHGNDEVRLCGGCNKNVYNISAMSKKEAERILNVPQLPCLGFTRNSAGSIITDECPPWIKPIRNSFRKMAGIAVSIMALIPFAPTAKGEDQLSSDDLHDNTRSPITKQVPTPARKQPFGVPVEFAPPSVVSSAWPTSIKTIGFENDDVPNMEKQQFGLVRNVELEHITPDDYGRNSRVSVLHFDTWKIIEQARCAQLKACLSYKRSALNDCIEFCDESTKHYEAAIEVVSKKDLHDPALLKFILNDRSKVKLLRNECVQVQEKFCRSQHNPSDLIDASKKN